MEALQLAQMLADLNDLQAAVCRFIHPATFRDTHTGQRSNGLVEKKKLNNWYRTIYLYIYVCI